MGEDWEKDIRISKQAAPETVCELVEKEGIVLGIWLESATTTKILRISLSWTTSIHYTQRIF